MQYLIFKAFFKKEAEIQEEIIKSEPFIFFLSARQQKHTETTKTSYCVGCDLNLIPKPSLDHEDILDDSVPTH